ncbi:MAG: fibronectin type III domain-containing protein [Alistipes sp.]|nr:fibronectin type III domain-containing protein [Alistipes sp.]
MKKNPFISRLATSVAAVALTIGTAFTFSACSDDDDVVDPATEASRLSVPVVNEVAEADITTSSLKFSWEAVEGASSYSAQIRLSEAGDIYRERMIENATEVTFENLDDNTAYYFRVRANHKLNESRNSAYSVYTMVKTVAADPAIPQLAVPANVMCDKSKTSETELTFMWDTVENASAGYAVTLTSIGVDDFTTTTTETSYTFTGLESGRQYFFTVRACEVKDGDNVVYAASKNSGAVKATTIGQLPAPANLKFQDKMAHAVKFVWDAVDNAKDYAYELQTLSVSGTTTVDEGLMSELSSAIVPGKIVYATATSNTSMTFVGLDNDAYYSFRVKAVSANDAYLDSEYTDYCVIKTLEFDPTPLAAPKLTVKNVMQVKVFFEWKEVVSEIANGVAGYDIQFAPAGTEVSDDDADYTIKIRPNETTGELALEAAVSTYGPDETAVEPGKAYKVRMRTYANENDDHVSNSVWTDWKEVKTPALAQALTISTAEELEVAVDCMAEGGVLTLKAGEYNTSKDYKLTSSITITGESATNRPKVNISQIVICPTAACDFIRIANIEFTNFKVNADGTLDNTSYLGKYFLDNSNQKAHVETMEVENCVVWGGFKCAFLRMNRTDFGANKLTIKDNIICVGGSDGAFVGANGKAIGKEWIITGNTIDAMGSVYGNTKWAQIVRFPNGGDEFVGKIENNTFYNISVIKAKDLFEAPQGTITVAKNIITIDTSPSAAGVWTKGLGIKATYTSTDNFIYDTTATIDGFTVVDPGFSSYEFLKNYKPTNADVIAAGAGDPRWLK